MRDHSDRRRPALFIVRTPTSIAALDLLLPAVELLGITGADPEQLLEAVAVAAVIVAKISPASQQWIGAVHVDVPGFQKLHAQWVILARAESEFRQAFPAFEQQPWPSAEALETIADMLRKRGFDQLFALVRGRGKVVREMLERLQLSGPPRIVVSVITRIAKHVRLIESFNHNPEALAILGRAWSGMSTPFDDIAAGINLRGFIEDKLRPLKGGDRVAAATIALSSDDLSALASFSDKAVMYLNMLYNSSARPSV